MNNVLVVFYSYTGTSRRLAELLSSQRGWQVAEIQEERPRSGPRGTWRCVLDSLLRRHPAIRYQGPVPKSFDAVVLVSPIWVGRLAGPMRSFLGRRRDELPDVAVALVMGSRGAPDADAEITRLIGKAPMLSTAFTTREVDDGSCAGRLESFGKAVLGAEESHAVVRQANLSPQAG